MHTDKRIQIHTDTRIQIHTDEKKRYTQIFVLICAIICINLWVNCNNAYCLNVSPGRIEINVALSKSYEDVLAIKNTEERDLEIKLRIEDWFKAVEGNAKKIGTFEWLEISPLEFGLKEGETKEVKFKVAVPKKAKGELNGMIFVEAKPKEIAEGAIGINTSIGVPIYVMVKGTERFKAEIEELKVMKGSPLELAITIKNSGNVHIRPTGVIEIFNADLRKLKMDSHRFTVPLNEYNYPVLPKSSRILEIRSDNKLEQGEYTADIKMGYGNKKYRKKITVIIK